MVSNSGVSNLSRHTAQHIHPNNRAGRQSATAPTAQPQEAQQNASQGGAGKLLLVLGITLGAGLIWRKEISQTYKAARNLIQPPKTGFFSVKENRDIVKQGGAGLVALWAVEGRRAENAARHARDAKAKAFYEQRKLEKEAAQTSAKSSPQDDEAVVGLQQSLGVLQQEYLEKQKKANAFKKPKQNVGVPQNNEIEPLLTAYAQKSQQARTEAEQQNLRFDLLKRLVKAQPEYKTLPAQVQLLVEANLDEKLKELSKDKAAFQKVIAGNAL